MEIRQVMEEGKLNFSGIPSSYFLIGLLTAFENRFQAYADKTMETISWKQFFAVICINLCREAPSIRELAEIMGSSHQNVKQILLKLQKKGIVEILEDKKDRRKQRVYLTESCRAFCAKNDQVSGKIMERMFGGISEEALLTTIQTIMKMEENLQNG